VDIDGIIHPVTVEIMSRAIDQAKRENADAILVRLNTPGGLMNAMQEVIEKIVASPVPVIVYVTPERRQGGFGRILSPRSRRRRRHGAGHHTRRCASRPDERSDGSGDEAKVENELSASLRSMAQKRGRNSELAEKAVLESKSFTEREALDNRLIDASPR
jgi:membrane-bound serine protease (ClpP class)